jgi:hypothetical protein
MLSYLPTELLLKTFKYLSVTDLVQLQRCNRVVYNSIRNNEEYLVTQELKHKYQTNKHDMYGVVTHLVDDLYKQARDHLLFATTKGCRLPIKEVHLLIFDNVFSYQICDNRLINRLFQKVFYWFLCYGNVHTFPKPLHIYILYRLLDIYVFYNTTSVEQNVKFLESLTKTTTTPASTSTIFLHQIASNYYQFVVKNKLDVKFDTFHCMTKYVTSLSILKRLFGCRTLNLDKSKLLICCPECTTEALVEICSFKFNRPDDYFLSHNYHVIKNHLKFNCPILFQELRRIELQLVNKEISYRYPLTRARVRLDSLYSCRLMYTYQFEHGKNHVEFIRLKRYIYKRQRQLLNRYFM